MTGSLADDLPREIARVSAKRDRWRDLMAAHPELSQSGMKISVAIMQAEIDAAVRACAEGDIGAMMAAHQSLADYSDDD